MKEAFNFMFKDNMFKKKAFIYVIVAFIANLISNIANTMAPQPNTAPTIQYIIIFIVGALLMLIPSGYGMSCIKAFIEQNENIVLPFLNVKNNFIIGFKLAVSVLIMALIFGLGITILAILLAIVFSMLKAISAGTIVLWVLMLALILILAYYSLAFCYIFVTTEKYTSFLQFRNATRLIKNDIKHYSLSALLFIGLTILVGILGTIITALLGLFGIVGLVLSTLITAFISGYTVYVFTYLTAKAVKNSD